MQEDIDAHDSNEAWRMTKNSPGSNALHTTWVSNTNTVNDGELERYKARLVACGNEKVIGVDYRHRDRHHDGKVESLVHLRGARSNVGSASQAWRNPERIGESR